MARRLPVGSGGGSSRRGGGGSHGGHHHKGRKRHGRRPRAKHPHARKVDMRGPVAEPVSAGSVWPRGDMAPGSVSPLVALEPGAAGAGEPLALVGAERGGVHDALAAWGRERDQALSRVWRRPGGLARLAGV